MSDATWNPPPEICPDNWMSPARTAIAFASSGVPLSSAKAAAPKISGRRKTKRGIPLVMRFAPIREQRGETLPASTIMRGAGQAIRAGSVFGNDRRLATSERQARPPSRDRATITSSAAPSARQDARSSVVSFAQAIERHGASSSLARPVSSGTSNGSTQGRRG